MDLTELILDIAKQGPLVGLLLYLMVKGDKKAEKDEIRINELHESKNTILKEELEKSRETINNNTIAINAFKDVLRK